MKARIIAILVALAAFAGGIGVLSRTVNERHEELAALTKEKLELDKLRAENRQLKTIRVDTAEIERLKQETAALPKLRNQERQLRESLQSQDAGEPAALSQLRSENEQLQEQLQLLQQLPSRSVCIQNLELIDAAKSQFAEKNGLLKGETVTMEDLAALFPNGIPVCPDGGHYSVNRVGSPPSCSISGHSIP
jgi:DNA repair exonuclease SbcCD ATPase subunit